MIILCQNISECKRLPSFDGKIRNNEREELEDQITKYTKQIYQVETENKSLQMKNMELNQKLREVVGEQESLTDLTGRNDMECGDETAGNLQEIVSVLDDRIQVRDHEIFFLSTLMDIVSQEICLKYERSKAKQKAQIEVMTLELGNKVRI